MENPDEMKFATMFAEVGVRLLAADGDKIVFDYTVFGMVLFTMILLLIVGVMRHKIDNWASGNDFLETVLEACYHELSTLGIVEAVVFILHKYYKGLNIQVETVFAEVHFTLFYCVIFNAIMSVLLFLCASRIANNQWVRSEAIDIDHYVAVRRQYDDVKRKLETLEANRSLKHNRKPSRSNDKDYRRSVSFQITHFEENNGNELLPSTLQKTSTVTEDDDDEISHWISKFWNYFVKRNFLRKKQHELLIQVRFHELRVHFIESHQLPPNFRLSDYLKLCMNDEFKNLVHVSSLSWAILIFVTNLIYFTMGMITFATEDGYKIGISLASFYLGYAIMFVLLSSIVFMKMKQIFNKIVKDDSWIEEISERKGDEGISDRNLDDLSTRTAEAVKDFNQNDYFWGSNPSIIVTMAQVMQFGYAISFAVLLVFKDTLELAATVQVWFGWFSILPIICYSFYLSLWCRIIPKYTQCTSLGKLVRKTHLIAVDAKSKLSKAKIRRQEEIDNLQEETEVAESTNVTTKLPKKPRQRKRQESLQSTLFRKFIGMQSEEENDTLDDSRKEGSMSHSERLCTLSSLVKKQTQNLPDENITRRRRDRKRSVSDGVAAMRFFTSTSSPAQLALSASALVEQGDPQVENMKGRLEAIPRSAENIKDYLESIPKPSGRRKKMASTGVFFMQSEKSTLFAEDQSGKTIATSSLINPTLTEKESGSIDGKNEKTTEKSLKLSTVRESDVDYKMLSLRDGDDDISVDSGSKQDDDLSIESGDSLELRESFQQVEKAVSLREKLHQIFLHKRYSTYSALFGTMPIFFFLSFRVELILIDTCVMADNQNTWNFLPSRGITFWFIVIWFCVLLVESSIICFLLSWQNTKLKREIFASAVFDIIVTTICLILFLWAEVKRCCECTNASIVLNVDPADKYGGCVFDRNSKCCPSFGTRLCGGLGTLEPFASLIGVRLFRFYIVKFCSLFFQKIHHLISKDNDLNESIALPNTDAPKEKDLTQDEVMQSEIESQHKMKPKTGTIAELWMAALVEYPEIVQKHGIFSGLLLEAMLGIDSLPVDKNYEIEDGDMNKDLTKGSHAGAISREKPSLRRGISTISLRSAGGNSISDLDIHDYNFVRPGAPLIRTMRRCECKWEWLKSSGSIQWDIVDVVLTECEIVWFNAAANATYWDEAEQLRLQKIKKSIIAKRGGKSIRLSDVAAGREVLGRMALADIDNIKIIRFAPIASTSGISNDGNTIVIDIEESLKGIDKEFWMEGNRINLPLEKQWEQVTEDRLKLHSNQGTLSLRFFVDLYELPTATRDKMERKKGALLWCETISHLCGKSNLKQKLPHFGEDRDNELQDFIESVPRQQAGDDDNKSFWKLHLPRVKSERRFLAQTL